MHDPLTVAFEIKYPWKDKPSTFWPEGYRHTFITIWHKDPELRGSDDSCGWFKRAHHGDPEVLEKITKRFEFDWDKTFTSEGTGKTYFTGLFCPNGEPYLSTQAVALNLFFLAAIEVKGTREKAVKFLSKHLMEILLFAENPWDSLHDSIVQKFGGEGKREDRISSMAACIYGWILRAERPWYRHPRWHVHHWRLQIHPLQTIWQWLFHRCAKCGKRFRYKESRIGSWSGTQVWHERCGNSEIDKTAA